MRKTHKIIFVSVAAVLLLAGITVYAVTNYGSETDPLITKSYLDEVVQPELERELEERLNDAADQLQRSVPGEFTELKLSSGQSIACSAGGELLLCSGSAKAAGTLADTTDGGSAADGTALTANHLYLAAEDGSGLTAGGSATVLVSGSYTLK